jgi:hypothetical protein
VLFTGMLRNFLLIARTKSARTAPVEIYQSLHRNRCTAIA